MLGRWSITAMIWALRVAACRANSASESGWARSPMAGATRGAAVLTKAGTSAASGHSFSRA